MSPRRRLVALLSAVTVLAGVTWTLVGGMTVAHGQEKPITIARAHKGSHRPSFTKPIFILALGTDSGAPRYGRPGNFAGGRADSIHVIAINPTLKKATIVGIPRDSYVPIACGASSPNKINAARGTDCMIATIERLSGGRLKFDYYMIGGFEQLEKAVNALGGIPVNVERPLGGVADDRPSRSAGMRGGLQTLTGPRALAYSRNRHDYGRGDFDRTVHQGQVLIGGLTKARQLVASDPGKVLSFLRIMFLNLKTSIPLGEAFHLGLLALQLSPADVTNTLLDGTTGTTAAGSSVLLSNPQRILADVADNAILG